jgi:membrane protein YdbS with pleckstrin-like domain
MRPQYVVLAIPVVALVATVWLPFVNTATLWLGLPSVMVWTGAWVLAITPALCLFEFSRGQREADRSEVERGAKR